MFKIIASSSLAITVKMPAKFRWQNASLVRTRLRIRLPLPALSKNGLVSELVYDSVSEAEVRKDIRVRVPSRSHETLWQRT